MKLNYDIKNKKAGFEADVEKLVEKSMEQHEKDWKDKFNTKHAAKKEILEIKHKQKMDLEENKKQKKNWIQKITEEKRKLKELEMEQKRRQEQKILMIKIISSSILFLVGIGFFIAGANNAPAYNAIGLFLFISVAYIWIV